MKVPNRMFASIRTRLLTLITIPYLIIFPLAVYFDYQASIKTLEIAFDHSLSDDVIGLFTHVNASPNEKITFNLPTSAENLMRMDPDDKEFFSVWGPDGQLLAGDADLLPKQSAMTEAPVLSDGYMRGLPIRRADFTAFIDGQRFYSVYAETLNKRRASVNTVFLSLILPDLAIIASSLLAVFFGVRLGLNPLKDIGNHIVSLDVNKLEKVPVKHVPLEALPLINAMNQLLYQLRDAHELQRKFIEDAAHQLRTPIAGIQMQLELAVHGDQNDLLARARQSLNDIKRLTYINGQFLALARVSTQGTLQQEFETIDVSQLIMDRAPDWLRLAESSDIQIAFSLEPTTLKGIPWLVGELLDNLVFNAIKHGVGGKFITVRCSEYEAGSAKSAILSVEDCGPGIAEQDKKRIFQRFERGANSSVPGSGLGLSIVAEVCRIHGAQYELLDAEKGSGLLFKIVFPLNKSI